MYIYEIYLTLDIYLHIKYFKQYSRNDYILEFMLETLEFIISILLTIPCIDCLFKNQR